MNFSTAVLLVVAALPLAACSQETGANDKEIADLRADLQRVQRESKSQKEQIASLDRRLNGLMEDVAHVNKVAIDSATTAAAAAKQAANSTAKSAAGASPGEAGAAADAPAVSAYLKSEDGKKAVADAVKAAQAQADQERMSRMADAALARLVKDANLTEDQTQKMKDIMSNGLTQLQSIFQSMRDGSPDDRDQVRQKFTDLRTNTETQVKTVLSQSQFEVFQKDFPRGIATGGFGGFGGRGGGGGGN